MGATSGRGRRANATRSPTGASASVMQHHQVVRVALVVRTIGAVRMVVERPGRLVIRRIIRLGGREVGVKPVTESPVADASSGGICWSGGRGHLSQHGTGALLRVVASIRVFRRLRLRRPRGIRVL